MSKVTAEDKMSRANKTIIAFVVAGLAVVGLVVWIFVKIAGYVFP